MDVCREAPRAPTASMYHVAPWRSREGVEPTNVKIFKCDVTIGLGQFNIRLNVENGVGREEIYMRDCMYM